MPLTPEPMERREERVVRTRAVHGVWVACIALLALTGIVVVAVMTLPDEQKGQNIIAISSASFGVIGAIVGAYFGVSSANRAAEIVHGTPPDLSKPEPAQRPSAS
jgi:hypothetical protein